MQNHLIIVVSASWETSFYWYACYFRCCSQMCVIGFSDSQFLSSLLLKKHAKVVHCMYLGNVVVIDQIEVWC